MLHVIIVFKSQNINLPTDMENKNYYFIAYKHAGGDKIFNDVTSLHPFKYIISKNKELVDAKKRLLINHSERIEKLKKEFQKINVFKRYFLDKTKYIVCGSSCIKYEIDNFPDFFNIIFFSEISESEFYDFMKNESVLFGSVC